MVFCLLSCGRRGLRRRGLLVRHHDVRDVDRVFLFDDRAGLSLLHRFDVLGLDVDALDDDLALLLVDREQLTDRALGNTKEKSKRA